MKQYTGLIYECEFCGKKSAWKHVITNHEKICKKKPINQHKCFQYCEYLEKTFAYHEDDEVGQTKFTCAITNENMYSYKVERQPWVNRGIIKNLKRMPLKCEHYECSGGNSGDYEPPAN